MIEENKILNKLLKHKNFGLPGHWITKHLIKPETKTTLKALSFIKPTPSLVAYRKKVMRLTEEKKHLIPGIEKRGFKSYHIDHKVSIWWGYKNGIPAEDIASLDNLRMLPYKDNMLKGIRCV